MKSGDKKIRKFEDIVGWQKTRESVKVIYQMTNELEEFISESTELRPLIDITYLPNAPMTDSPYLPITYRPLPVIFYK